MTEKTYTRWVFEVVVENQHDDDIHTAAERVYEDPDRYLVSIVPVGEEEE